MAEVQLVECPNCGAPLDLNEDGFCIHCRARLRNPTPSDAAPLPPPRHDPQVAAQNAAAYDRGHPLTSAIWNAIGFGVICGAIPMAFIALGPAVVLFVEAAMWISVGLLVLRNRIEKHDGREHYRTITVALFVGIGLIFALLGVAVA